VIHTRMARSALLLATLAVVACDDDDDPTEPTGTLTLNVSRTTLDVAAGSDDTLTVTIARGGGFAGPVVLSVTGAPAGVTAAFDKSTLGATDVSTPVTITVVAAVAPGAYPLTVKADANGAPDREAVVTLNVVAASVAGFSLAVTPDTARVTQGATGNTLVTLTRTGGFADAVAITTDSLPSGVTAAVTAPSLAGDTTTIVLTASATATPGTYRFFVNGTAGTVVRRDTIPIVVSASSIIGALKTNSPLRLLAARHARSDVTIPVMRRHRSPDPLWRGDRTGISD
jgi:uncharacterized membrane protein